MDICNALNTNTWKPMYTANHEHGCFEPSNPICMIGSGSEAPIMPNLLRYGTHDVAILGRTHGDKDNRSS